MITSISKELDKTASLYGDKIAVVDPDNKITYLQLQSVAKAIASAILKNAKGSSTIGIYADKSVISTCALWGVIYAGFSYTFIDTALPVERIKKICDALEPDIILTDEMHKDSLGDIFSKMTILCMENIIHTRIDCDALIKAEKTYSCSKPLYINFTSGTTGEPKGVVISQCSVIDFIENFVSLFSITSDDIIGNQAPFDFDVSVKDIFSCAFTGATLVIIPRSYFTKPKVLIDYICDEHVTTLIWAVSAMTFVSVMKGFMYRLPAEINKVMFSGEVMPYKHLEYWRSNLKNAIFVNLFGPTEITCNCTYHVLDRGVRYDKGIPIGVPLPNNNIYLLNEDDELIIDKNIEGEICVSGICLSLGYINNESQTMKHFAQNPSNNMFREIIYRTGDIGKYGEDELLYFLGRKDTQIKRLGHRIELGEIEACTERIAKIEQAVCVYYEEKSKLLLFYIGSTEKFIISDALKKGLPTHMIPDVYIKTDYIPLTKNGKTDRKMLLETYIRGDCNEPI